MKEQTDELSYISYKLSYFYFNCYHYINNWFLHFLYILWCDECSDDLRQLTKSSAKYTVRDKETRKKLLELNWCIFKTLSDISLARSLCKKECSLTTYFVMKNINS